MSASPSVREGPQHFKLPMDRSPIYALPSLGGDAGDHECLTSYLQRLSSQHSIFCGDFVNHILLPKVSNLVKARNLRLCKVSHSMNGSGSYAKAFEQALSAIWPKQSLPKPATFTFLSSLVGDMPRRLVSDYVQWCPACLKAQEGNYFFPLYWQSSLSQCCTKHHLRLINRCHSCGKGIRQIVSIGTLGWCPYCGAKLEDAPSTIVPNCQRYEAEQVRTLVTNRDELKCLDLSRTWLCFLEQLANKSRNISRLEAALGLCDTQISQWLHRSRPELFGVLRLSKALKIDAVEILSGSELDSEFSALADVDWSRPKSRRAHKRSKKEVVYIGMAIRKLLDEESVNSMKAASRALGVSVGFIDYHFPELATELKKASLEAVKQDREKLDAELQYAVNREVQTYYETNQVFPSVNQLKVTLSSTPGNSKISQLHVLKAKSFIRSPNTQFYKSFSRNFSGDHSHGFNKQGDS